MIWETGVTITLTNKFTGHELDLLVDASLANKKNKPLLFSLPSKPFSRLRPSLKQQQQHQQSISIQQDEHDTCSYYIPIAIDGKAVGKESLWFVHSKTTTTTTSTEPQEDVVTIESVAHQGVYLSFNKCGRVTCLRKPINNSMQCCTFHAKLAAISTNTTNDDCSNMAICKDSVVCGNIYSRIIIEQQKPQQQQKIMQSGGPLSNSAILQFAEDGYLLLRNAVDRKIWEPAAASVFGGLGDPGAIVHGGDSSNSGHKVAGKLDGRYTQTPQMRAVLGSDSIIAQAAAQLMGKESLSEAIDIAQTSAQVALRFPEPSLLGLYGVAVPEDDGLWAKVKRSCTIRGESSSTEKNIHDKEEVKVDRQEENQNQNQNDRVKCNREIQANYLRELGVKWHIDGTRQRQYHGFSLLMGVALSDCGIECDVASPSELEGQLCVWPRSHQSLQGMGKMCEPKAVDYASLIKDGYPLNDYEYFDYLDSADEISKARSMEFLGATAVDAISEISHCENDRTNTPICDSSPGGFGPKIIAMKAGDGVILHCETAHAATPNFNASKVRAMVYYRLRLLPCTDNQSTTNFRGDEDRKDMRESYEWGMEYDRTMSSVQNTTTETPSSDIFTPEAVATAKQILSKLYPDLIGVSEVLFEHVDNIVYQQQAHVDTKSQTTKESINTLKDKKITGLKLLRFCRLHPRSFTNDLCR